MEHLIHSCLLAILFYGLYRIVLKGTSGFQWHRIYLLAIPVVSFLLPFLVIPIDQTIVTPEFLTVKTIDVTPIILNTSAQTVSTATPFINTSLLLWVVYATGIAVALLLFFIKLARIQHYQDNGNTVYRNGIFITRVNDLPTAFSFLNHIYINDAMAGDRYSQVLLHETTHVKERHSWDLLFYEAMRILFWFHPVSYLAQNELKIVHEHIADQKTIAIYGKQSYYENLLKEVMDCPDFSFANPFFKSKTIKTRLTMIQKTQNNKFPFRKLLWMLPVLFASLTYTASTAQTSPTTDIEMEAFTKDGPYSDLSQDEIELIRKIKLFYLKPTEEQNDTQGSVFSLLELTRKDYKWLTIAAIDGIHVDKSKNGKTVKTLKFDDQELYEAMIKTRFLTDLNQKELEEYAKKMNAEQDQVSNVKRLEIVEDIIEIEEVKEVEGEVKEVADVPFAIIENVPTYPGCAGTNAEKKRCMQEKITALVTDNFDTSIAAKAGMEGKQRISVQFRIDSNGEVEDILARAKAPELETEAKRVVQLMPKMKPGTQRGQNVNVIYALPIIFEIAPETDKQKIPE